MLTSRPLRDCRGSALLMALMFAALIGIALSSYIALGNNSLKQASRSFYASSAVNVAELGLELAVACFNQVDKVDPATPEAAWPGWTINNTPYDVSTSPLTPSATRTFSGFDVGPNATAIVKVYAHHYAGSLTADPKLVAEATITVPDGPTITKTIEVTLKKRSLFGDGVSAIENITVNGSGFEGHSWDSNPDNLESTAPVPYTATAETANLTMGSVMGNISLGGGEIWGYAKVSDETHAISGGAVHGPGPADTTPDDPDRRTDDFDANFPTKLAPTYTTNPITTAIKDTTTFPRTGDVAIPATGPDATYYYRFSSTGSISPTGSNSINIEAGKNVVFIMEEHASGPSVITISGSQSMTIGAGATLNIYTNGDVSIGGSGLANDNLDPKSFMLWSSGTRTISISGNGTLTGVVYAPGAPVVLSGGGSPSGTASMYGAVVGRDVTFNGNNTHFYYDESLADLTLGNPYGASKWKELQSATERDVYAGVFTF
jgi:hypothetical protein